MYVSLDLKLFPSREYWKVEIRGLKKKRKKEEEEKERVGKYRSSKRSELARISQTLIYSVYLSGYSVYSHPNSRSWYPNLRPAELIQ